jgi:hypothetical protein
MKKVLFLVGMLGLVPIAHGQPLPDWSGAWIIPEQDFIREVISELTPGNPRAPALTAAAAAVAGAQFRRVQTGKDPEGAPPPRTNGELCLPPGMPDIMRYPVAIEILFSSGRVTLISEEGPSVRRIYTDGRPHAADVEPTYLGNSIGRWEGDTLVVETTSISAKAQLVPAVKTSGRARVMERMRLKDATHLQIDTVVEDPGVLQHPWRYTRVYQRIAPAFVETVCLENNRDLAGGEPDLTPPEARGVR